MKKILLFFFLSAWIFQVNAQQITITGKITTKSDGVALPGAYIVQKGSSKGTITDFAGEYSLKVDANSTLVFSFIGYKSQEIELKDQTLININLEEDLNTIEEVVVVGYGTQKKSLVTGAIAKVDAIEIARGANMRVTQAIQGKTAGVVIANNSGQPGDFVSVSIRGVGTNGDSQPLYIVDGMPANGFGIDYLSPSDISSIEVMKDAASCAIYGARGANGVVIITTKTGKRGQKFEVAYDAYYGVQNPIKKLTTLNKAQYLEVMREGYANEGAAFPWSQDKIDKFADTDWQDEMFVKNAVKTSHVISFTGGGDNNSYSSSLSYFKQDGIVGKGKSNFERFTWRLNTERQFGILTVGMNFNLANMNSQGIDTNDRYGISLAQAANMPPVVPVFDTDGSYATPDKFLGIGMQEITNPVALLSIKNNESVTNKVNGGLWGEIDFGKISPKLAGLKFKSQYTTEYAYVNNRSYTPVYNFAATKRNDINSASGKIDKYVSWNFDNFLTYDKTIQEHHFTVLAGVSGFKSWSTFVEGSRKNLVFNTFENAYLNNSGDSKTAGSSGDYKEHTTASYIGRLNYDFRNKYMFTAIVRTDGSSRFGGNNKFGTFPSVSGGWVVSNESFMPANNLLSLLKVRASWGRNGSENIDDFKYTTTMSNNLNTFFGDTKSMVSGSQPNYFPNPDLKWETSEQTDIAIETGFFKNRLTLTLDYYNKKTKDWLVTPSTPMLSGNSAPTINGGAISNKGIEIELGYKTNIKDFKFDINLTGAFNKNEVLEINNSEKVINRGDGGFGQGGIKRFSIGEAAGYFYGYKVDGVFQTKADADAYVDSKGEKIQKDATAGDFKFVDQNGDGKLNDADRVNLGKPTPDFTGGINMNASWKGFDVNMFWYAALGQNIWMALRRYDQNISNYTSEYYKNRWTGPGSTNEYPRLVATDKNSNWKNPSSFYVKDASYVRLKNLSIGYSLPKNITQFLKLTKLRVYVSGENLFTATKYEGYEPEIGGSIWDSGIDRGIYPQARSVIGGINITF